jgi:hypothetical protein
MSDLISRCELFNRLATVRAEDANEMKGKIYAIIQEMPTSNLQHLTETYKGNEYNGSIKD